MRRLFTVLGAAVVLAWMPIAHASAETVLLMGEQIGCHWCERWDEEIGPIYPKTAEGKVAPLQRFDIHVGVPDGITLERPVNFTPTFVLVRDGVEVARLEGYPGEDLFWTMLSVVMQRAEIELKPESSG